MKGRVFTPEFKLGVVQAALSGEKSVVQLCREYSISDSCIHNWKKLYREKGEAAFTAPTIARCGSTGAALSVEEHQLVALRNKIAELERFIGQQAVELSILKKVSELLSSPSRNGVK